MPKQKVGTVGQLPLGVAGKVKIKDGVYALCNVDGILYCVDGLCPHAGGPLGQRALHGSYLVCPWHAWEFDCGTGALESGSG